MPTQSNLMGSGCPALQAQASVGVPTLTATAAGTNQGNALPLPSDGVLFTTVAASTGTILPATGPQCNVFDSFIIVNHGANTLSVYPPVGGKIANGSANAAFSVAATKTAWFISLGGGNFAASLSA